jgi:hypothetical protein
LDTTETERVLREGEAGIGGVEGTEGLGCVLFEEWWRRWLGVVNAGTSS